MNKKDLYAVGVTRDPTLSQTLHHLSGREGWTVVLFEDPAQVFTARIETVDLLVLDEAAVGSHYVSVAKRARKRYPALDVFVVGGPKSDEVRQSDRQQGVDYYYERPLDEAAFERAIGHRLDIARLKGEVGIVGRSDAVVDVLEAILQVGPTEVPILIEGESGTGKDVVARAIHLASKRREGPYVAINCASLAEGVLESELFGHEKGAFTGAVGQRAGVFERADTGTIFLDEVGEMSANMQVRLLRVLESGEVLRVGGVKSFQVDVRVVAATNRNLANAVTAGAFRQDLYYRLKGVSLYLPPLRDRREDIPLLVDHFVSQANAKHHRDVKAVDSDAMRRLAESPWPGNVRELRNVVDTAVVLSTSGRITRSQVASQLEAEPSPTSSLLPVPVGWTGDTGEREMIYASILALHRDVREILSLLRGQLDSGPLHSMREVFPEGQDGPAAVHDLASLERAAIVDALKASDGNRRKASEMLGISERTLYRKIKEYGLL